MTPQTKPKERIKENVPVATTTSDPGSAANMGESMAVMIIPVPAAVMICHQPQATLFDAAPRTESRPAPIAFSLYSEIPTWI